MRVQRGGRTGCVVVVEPGGQRTIFPDRAAAVELTAVDGAWLDGVEWLRAPAYSLRAEPIGQSTAGTVEQVRATGGRLSVDVSSVGTVEAFGAARFVELARFDPDVVLATAEEAALLGAWRLRLLVITRGSGPVTVAPRSGAAVDVGVATLGGASPLDAAAAGVALARRTLRSAGAPLAP